MCFLCIWKGWLEKAKLPFLRSASRHVMEVGLQPTSCLSQGLPSPDCTLLKWQIFSLGAHAALGRKAFLGHNQRNFFSPFSFRHSPWIFFFPDKRREKRSCFSVTVDQEPDLLLAWLGRCFGDQKSWPLHPAVLSVSCSASLSIKMQNSRSLSSLQGKGNC